MKLTLTAALLAASLAGCASNPLGQANQACTAWAATQTTTLQLAQAGKLTTAQIKAFQQADAVATPACTGTPPATAASAAALASKVATETAILAAMNKGAK